MRRIDVENTLLAMLLGAALWFLTVGQCHAQSSDPSGFTDSLNVARGARGLDPAAHDRALVSTALANNSWQRVYGLGHHVTGGLWQVACIGSGDVSRVLATWSGSAAHAAMIYSPNLVSVGYANDGWAATATLVMGTPGNPHWTGDGSAGHRQGDDQTLGSVQTGGNFTPYQPNHPWTTQPGVPSIPVQRVDCKPLSGCGATYCRVATQPPSTSGCVPRQRGFHPLRRLLWDCR